VGSLATPSAAASNTAALHHLPLRRGLKTGHRPQERTLTGDTGNGAAGLFTVQFYRQATYYLQDT
jgi:hypothetical protein